MAVQKSKKTPSRRGMRRSHDGVRAPTLIDDKKAGVLRRRHHLSETGHYRGRLVVDDRGDLGEDSSE